MRTPGHGELESSHEGSRPPDTTVFARGVSGCRTVAGKGRDGSDAVNTGATRLLPLALLLVAVAAQRQLSGQESVGDSDAEAPAGRVVIEGTAGEQSGELADLRYDAPSGDLVLGDGRVPLNSVSSIVISADRPLQTGAPLVLLLRTDEEIRAAPRGGTEEIVRFRADWTPQSDTDVELSIEKLQAILNPERFEDAQHFRAFKSSLPGRRRDAIEPRSTSWRLAGAAAPTGTGGDEGPQAATAAQDDILWTAEGSTLEGFLLRVTGEAVHFEAADVGEVPVAFDRFRAVKLANLGPPQPQPEASGVVVQCADGSYLRGQVTALQNGRLTIDSRGVGPVEIDLRKVGVIEVPGGQTTYLSDLQPQEATSEDPFAPRAVQRDRNVLGGPLRLRGRTFRKGLGMRSHTRLVYAIDDSFARFRATVGIDDDAASTTIQSRLNGGGTAVFRVRIDDRLVLDKQLSYRDPPEPVDVDVSSGRQLVLEVEHGPGLWMQDYANWADARFVKKAP